MHLDDIIHEVVIIGAGLAGLTAAFTLKKRGMDALLLEKDADIGGSWARRHPRLTLNTHRDLSSLPELNYPPGTAAFPKRDVVVSHLREFARIHDFDIRHGVDVVSVSNDEGLFRIDTSVGPILSKNVIMATGRDARLVLPRWKGLDHYRGRVLHAGDFGDAGDYAGKSVLVVGGGNSGFDILNHLSRVKTGAVWFSVRRGPSILPKRLGRFAVHRLSPIMAMLPTVVVDGLIAWTQFVAFGRGSRLGFPAGKADAATRLANAQIAIPVDDGAVDAIKKGRITIVPAVVEFTPNSVRLADGRDLAPDVVIAAAGYASSLPHLLETIPVLNDEGYPRRNGRTISHSVPGLWFIGMTPTLTSYFHATRREAIRIADDIVAKRGLPADASRRG